MKYYILYKPYGMLSQFTREVESHVTLADVPFEFNKHVYPVGRLDADSEGLLLLTDDKTLNQKLLNPDNKQPKTYWAQVEGEATIQKLSAFADGLQLRINKKQFTALPAEYKVLPNSVEEKLPKRNPPIRERKNIPTTWVELQLVEGKNRQVRKMFAAVGFPVLRLIRVGLAGLHYNQAPLKAMQPNDVVEIERSQLQLHL